MRQIEHSVLKEIQVLKKEVRGLREDVSRERDGLLLGALVRRGFRCFKREHVGGLMLPSRVGSQAEFYGLLKKYSFRLFLRDVIKYKQSFSLQDLLRYCSQQVARGYLNVLLRGGLIVRTSGRKYRLRDQRITSFGDTLEWLVCQILEREFRVPSDWGIRVEDNYWGGDFDVIGLMEGHFVYIETKSSPPRNVEQQEVAAFFDRLETLRPHLAIFLEDTQLRMRDKIAVMFENELRRRYGASWKRRMPLVQLERQIFGINNCIFVTNSDPDLVINVSFCLGHYLRSQGVRLGVLS